MSRNGRKNSGSKSKASKVTPNSNGRSKISQPKNPQQRTYSIPDFRLEQPAFSVSQDCGGTTVCYDITGNLDAAVPPIRESKYLDKKQCIEIYRWMLLNRKMETALENLYKQGKVVGGVYFGLGQEACSCASAYALRADDWVAPMIRNQGSLLVRGFAPRDMMMQYMAKAGSPNRRARRHLSLRGHPETQCSFSHFDVGRSYSGNGRGSVRSETSREKHRGNDLHRRWRSVHRRHLRGH